MKSILFFVDYFHPAFKSGGPAHSSLGYVNNLHHFFKIQILTQNHDVGDTTELPGITSNQWNMVKDVRVFYASRKYYVKHLSSIVKSVSFDAYHFNSFFSFFYTILPLLLIKTGVLPDKPVIITPRGELGNGALSIKIYKKNLYLYLFKSISKRITFHATSEIEKGEIQHVLGPAAKRVIVAPDTRSTAEFEHFTYTPPVKETGLLKAVFISRLTPKKNIEYCFEVLRHVKKRVQFHFYGLMEDKVYFEQILQTAQNLNNEHLEIEYKGELLQHQVIDIIRLYDILFFPTKSENFGHIILESMISSRPVLISDQTFWRDLESSHSGWDIPLTKKEKFSQIIENLCECNYCEFEKYSKGAFQKAKQYLNDPAMVESYKNLYSRVN